MRIAVTEQHPNAPWGWGLIFFDFNNQPMELDGAYKCHVKDLVGNVVLSFQSINAIEGTIAIVPYSLDGQDVDCMVFDASQALVEDIAPGVYLADVIQIDEPDWIVGLIVPVEKGMTAP